MRKSESCLACRGAFFAGVAVYRSASGVILNEGIHGELPSRLIGKFLLIRNGEILYARIGVWIPNDYNEPIRKEDCDMESASNIRTPSSAMGPTEGGRGSASPPQDNLQSSARTANTSDSSPYVIETPDARKRILMNKDPRGGNTLVRLELEDGDTMRRRDSPNGLSAWGIRAGEMFRK